MNRARIKSPHPCQKLAGAVDGMRARPKIQCNAHAQSVLAYTYDARRSAGQDFSSISSHT
jgi:hypothetical protein